MFIDADGNLNCDQCKAVFKRERHFKSHRCEATSDYVAPENVEELREGFDSRERFGEPPVRPFTAEDLAEDDQDEVSGVLPCLASMQPSCTVSVLDQ